MSPYKYSPASKAKFATLCPELQDTMELVLQRWDHTIFFGFRGRADQEKALADGFTTKPFGASKHNVLPSDAVDAGPFYPEVPTGGIDWRTDKDLMIAARNGDWTAFRVILENIKRWYAFSAFVRGVGWGKGRYIIRSGCDWNNDQRFNDHRLIDLPHHEIVRPPEEPK